MNKKNSIVLAGLLLSASALMANTNNLKQEVSSISLQKEKTQKEQNRLDNIVKNTITDHKKQLQHEQGFVLGIQKMVLAMKSLSNEDKNTAKDKLLEAAKSIRDAFQKEPNMKMVPVYDKEMIHVFNGSVELINKIRDYSYVLVKDNEIQTAIDVLTPMQDEIVMTTSYLPVYLYPEAIKEAQYKIDIGDLKGAKDVLYKALNMLEVKQVIIPIPLITAQDMIVEASKLDKSKKDEIMKLLSAAKYELKRAVALGYTKKYNVDYLSLNNQIEKMEKDLGLKKDIKSSFEKIIKDFKGLIHKIS